MQIFRKLIRLNYKLYENGYYYSNNKPESLVIVEKINYSDNFYKNKKFSIRLIDVGSIIKTDS